MKTMTKTKRAVKTARLRKRPTVGERIIEGLEQAIAWTGGKNDRVCTTLVHAPEVDVHEIRAKMGLS